MAYPLKSMAPPTPPARPTAKMVGDAFAEQYYHATKNLPDELHRFYTDASKIGRFIGHDGVMRLSTLSDIDDNLNVLSFGGFDSAVVTSVTSQDSNGGSVMVNIGGYFTFKEKPERRSFTQGFFLAPQEQPRGYTVSNDILRFDDQPALPANNDDDSQRVSGPNDGIEDVSEISNASVAKVVGDSFAKRYFELLQNMPQLLHKVYQHNSQITRPVEGGMRRFSLSDIDESLNMVSAGGFDSVEVTNVSSQDSQCGGVLVLVSGYFILNKRRERTFIQTFFLARQEAPNCYFVFTDIFHFVDKPGAKDGRVVYGEDVNNDALSSTVHVRSLPPGARNYTAIRHAFKKFGPVKHNGIRIISSGPTYCHAFVEFKEENAAKRAIEASRVWIAGGKVIVEKMRGSDEWEEQKRIREEEAAMDKEGTREQVQDYNFWQWLKQMEIQSWLLGDHQYRDYSQSKVMEEHNKFLEQIERKLQDDENQN